jgi:hypothetical protein
MSENLPESESVQTEPGPVKAAQIAAEAPQPPKKGFLHRLFNPETRLGRGMRTFTRGLGLVVGLFALGFLTTYVLLFQPLERRYRTAQTELAQTTAALETLQGDLKLSQNSLVGAEQERKTASAQLAKAQTRVDVQLAKVKAMETRLALAQKDNAAARLALGEVEKILTVLKPGLKAASGESLDKVLALVKSDISRDATLADQDLQRLLSELELIYQGLEE